MLPHGFEQPGAALLLIAGVLACFAGHRFFRLVLGLYCFLIGAMVASSIVGVSNTTGMMIAASLAQIGEFSFVLAGMGVALGLLSTETYNLILASALISIALNPLLFKLAEMLGGDRNPEEHSLASP